MDGYLDQQVPYTLANVRMEKSVLKARYVLVVVFFFVFSCVLDALRSSRLSVSVSLASARVVFTPSVRVG